MNQFHSDRKGSWEYPEKTISGCLGKNHRENSIKKKIFL